MSVSSPQPDRTSERQLPRPDITDVEREQLPEDRPLDDVEHELLDGQRSADHAAPPPNTNDGVQAQFIVEGGARIRCSGCASSINAAYLSADTIGRAEGASDPADNVLVIPLRCPVCGAIGTLTTPFGADASEDEGNVLSAMPRTNAVGA